MVLTLWMLGFQTLRVLFFAWLTLFPVTVLFPHMSHTRAIVFLPSIEIRGGRNIHENAGSVNGARTAYAGGSSSGITTQRMRYTRIPGNAAEITDMTT
jgi:hypothetical protein